MLQMIFAVAVVHGRTRSLVEKFERRERTVIIEDQIDVQAPKTSPEVLPDRIKSSIILVRFPVNNFLAYCFL